MKVLEFMGFIGDADMVISFAVFVATRRNRWQRAVDFARREAHHAKTALTLIYVADGKLL